MSILIQLVRKNSEDNKRYAAAWYQRNKARLNPHRVIYNRERAHKQEKWKNLVIKKYRLPGTFTQTDAAWLAAAIDGEGSIGIYKYMRGDRKNKLCIWPRIKICNTNLAFIEHAKQITTFGCINHPNPRGKRKQIHNWLVDGRSQTDEILTAILPYLIIKREQAQIVLDYLKLRTDKILAAKWNVVESRYDERELVFIDRVREANSKSGHWHGVVNV